MKFVNGFYSLESPLSKSVTGRIQTLSLARLLRNTMFGSHTAQESSVLLLLSSEIYKVEHLQTRKCEVSQMLGGGGAPSHNAYPHKRGNWVRTWEVNIKKTIKSILEMSMYKTLTA